MSRIKASVIGTDSKFGGVASPTSDLKYGGQGGYMPAFGIADGASDGAVEEWISNQAYVKRNVIPVVLKYPRFFDFLPEKKKLVEAYKALFELHPLSIDGLTSGLTVEFDEHAIGGSGEMQEDVTNVTRARSVPTFVYKEKAGKAISKFVDFVIRYGYMDPDTKQPLIAPFMTTSGASSYDATKEIYSPEFTTGTVIFIEPDILQKTVVDAWLCVNMMFKGNGERTGKRDVHVAGEAPEITLESTAITLNNEPVMKLAQKILDDMVVIDEFPDENMDLPINGIESGVSDSETGFDNHVY